MIKTKQQKRTVQKMIMKIGKNGLTKIKTETKINEFSTTIKKIIKNIQEYNDKDTIQNK